MTAPARLMVVRALIVASACAVSFGAYAQAPSQTQKTEAPQASQKKISVSFRGNLRDALKKIATTGGLNLVVTGDLSQDSEVYLKDVTAEEALRTVAQAYDLRIQQSGTIWTLRPMTKEERAAAPEAPQAPAAAEAPAAVPAPPEPPKVAAPAAPPGVPVPPAVNITPGMTEDAVEEAMRSAEEYAEKTEAQAQVLAEQAEAEAEKAQESAVAMREEARQKAEEMREQARQAREQAREARERAREIERKAREAIRQATRNIDRIPAVGAGSVEVKEGEVVEDAVAYGGPLKVFGHVQGDAVSLGGDITLGPKAWVEGDVVAMGGSIHRDEGAVVDGEVHSMGGAVIGQAVKEGVKEMRGARHDVDRHRGNDGAGIASFLVWFMLLFGLGFVANLFFPARMKLVQEEIRRKPWKNMGMGFLVSLALAPLSLLLVITLIGIPLALVLWPLAMLAFAVGTTSVASELGMRLPFFRGRKTQALVLAIGLALMVAVGHIPVLGPIVTVTLGMIGFGAIITTRFGRGAVSPPPGPMTPTDIPTGVPV